MYARTVGEKPVKQWLGVYKGIVVNNADPLGLQRVQAQVPQVMGTAMTTWASPLLPIGEVGPPTGTFIAVVFLGGDPDKPCYINQVASATDWTLPTLQVGDAVTQVGTFTVYGANGTTPASNITGGLQVDNLTVTGNDTNDGTITTDNLVVTGLIQTSGWIDPNTNAQAVWHSLSLNGSFTNPSGAGVNGMFYKWGMDGCVEIMWDFVLISGNGGATLATLPSGYRPTVQQNLFSGWNNQAATSLADVAAFAPYIQVSSNGAIVFDSVNSNTSNTDLHGYCRIQLGSI